MKALSVSQMQDLPMGGGWIAGICAGLGFSGGIGAIAIRAGLVTVSSGPAATVVGVAAGVAAVGCGAYAIYNVV